MYFRNDCSCTVVAEFADAAPDEKANANAIWGNSIYGTTAGANNALVISDYSSYTAQYRSSLGRIFYDGFND